jgi:hypothetical protein
MEKEMTRKEFMATLALGLGSIMGFSTIIRLLTGRSLDRHLGHASAGYGSSAYGGSKQ